MSDKIVDVWKKSESWKTINVTSIEEVSWLLRKHLVICGNLKDDRESMMGNYWKNFFKLKEATGKRMAEVAKYREGRVKFFPDRPFLRIEFNLEMLYLMNA